MFSLFGKKKIIGLDVGTSSIKVAELDVSKKGSTLLAFGMVPTPPQSFLNGDVTDANTLSSAIRELITKIKTKRKDVAAGLGGTSVIVKRINIPRVDEKLIGEQIRWEAEQYIPYDINEVNLAFEILKKTNSSSETLDLLLVAAVQSHVFKFAEAIVLAGLNCNILDVSGFALVNCFKSNYGAMEGQSVALLNIGASATTMVVIENSEAVFSRDIPVGGLNYTMDLQKALGVSQEEAESIKLSASRGEAAPAEALSVIESTHEIVSDEIKASIDFYLNTARSHNLSRCFVTGGGSKTLGLMDRISNFVSCEKLNSFYSIKSNPKEFSQDYLSHINDFAAVAVGLGLRQVGDS